MKFSTLNGRIINKNYNKYLINWDKNEASKIQTIVKNFLKPYIFTHVVYSEFPLVGTLLRVDILDTTTKIAYEIAGRQHSEYIPFYHQYPSNYLKQIKNDIKKAKWLELNNFKLIEINYDEVKYISKEYFATKHNLIL